MAETKIIAAIIIGIIVLALALYFLLNVMKILPFPFGIWDADTVTAITSTVALRCAIDFSATGNADICTCTGRTQDCPQGMLKKGEHVLTFDLGLGQKLTITANKRDFGNKIEYTFTPTSLAISKKVYCYRDTSSCVVEEFTLPHEYTRGGLVGGLLSNIPVLSQMPVLGNPTDFFNRWVGVIGEPRFSVYYQEFNPDYPVVWTPAEKPNVMMWAALGGFINSAGGLVGGAKGFVGAAGKSVKIFINKGLVKVGLKEATAELESQSVKAVWSAWKNRLFESLLGKGLYRAAFKATEKEVAETAARVTAGRIAAKTIVDVEREVNRAFSSYIERNLAKTEIEEIRNYLTNKLISYGVDAAKARDAVDVLIKKYLQKTSGEFMFTVDAKGAITVQRAYLGKVYAADENIIKGAFGENVGKRLFSEAGKDGATQEAVGQLYMLKASASEVDLSKENFEILSKLKNEDYENLLDYIKKINNKLDTPFNFGDVISQSGFKTGIKAVVDGLDSNIDNIVEATVGKNGVLTDLMGFSKYSHVKGVKNAVEIINSEVDAIVPYAYDELIQQSSAILKSGDDALIKKFTDSLAKVPEKFRNSFSTDAVNLLENKAKTFWSKIKPEVGYGTLAWFRGYAGIPTSFAKDELVGYGSVLLTYAAGYLYSITHPRTEKFAPCGGNSLCLHTSSFISAYPNNTIPFPLASNIGLVGSDYGPPSAFSDAPFFIGFLLGQGSTDKGVVLSPCKADIIVSVDRELKDVNKCRTADTSVIVYSVSKFGCVCSTGSNTERVELDTKYYISKYGRCPVSKDELDGRDALKFSIDYRLNTVTTRVKDSDVCAQTSPISTFSPVHFTINGNTYNNWECTDFMVDPQGVATACNIASNVNPLKDFIPVSSCPTKDYVNCATRHFLEKYDDSISSEDKELLSNGFNLFEVNPLNVKPDKNGIQTVIKDCFSTQYDKPYNTGWNSLPNGYRIIKINPDWNSVRDYSSGKKGGRPFDYNYCMYNQGSRAQWTQQMWSTLQLAGSIAIDVAVGLATGGAGLAITIPAQFAWGALGSWGELRVASTIGWPCYQGPGNEDLWKAFTDFWTILIWGSDGCKGVCLNGVNNYGTCK